MTTDEAPCHGGPAVAAARGYQPIADYAAIGDCHGGALVARDGSIDWCSLERFDADPVFCRLLDADKGGFLWIRPEESFSATRAYLDGTNILRTEFRTASGSVAVLDFMPVGRKPNAGIHDYVSLSAPGWLVRRIEGLEGVVGLVITYRPSVAFAREPIMLHAAGGAIRAPQAPALHSDIPLMIHGGNAIGRTVVHAGDRRFAVLAPEAASVTPDHIESLLSVTTAFWREWIAYCRYDGPYADMVRRSALVLKLLTYAPSGAIVAAMTTSLPECIGGERNWDYRYCWIRDASLTLHGLAALGYSGEARRFYDFLCRAPRGSFPRLQVMYGIEGREELTERSIEQLSGYCNSRPVRAGNAAYSQRQTDLYGYVMDGVLSYRTLGARPSRADRRMFEELIAFIAECWPEPDKGIWEVRDAPRHFVHSKAMCWVAVDRAIRLFGERGDWISLRDRIWQDIVLHGYDAARERFRRAYGGDDTDAALLLLPMLGLPIKAGSFKPTLAAIEHELRCGDFVRRYYAEDGVQGAEGYFILCSFWLVDALLATERYDEARALFERLLACANDVGLYAEQIDLRTRAFLGNFPQAFTHLGLLGSAVNLKLFEQHGASAVQGTYADRAKRAIGATFGWRAVVAALLQSRGQLKFRSSRQSRFLPLPSRRSQP